MTPALLASSTMLCLCECQRNIPAACAQAHEALLRLLLRQNMPGRAAGRLRQTRVRLPDEQPAKQCRQSAQQPTCLKQQRKKRKTAKKRSTKC